MVLESDVERCPRALIGGFRVGPRGEQGLDHLEPLVDLPTSLFLFIHDDALPKL